MGYIIFLQRKEDKTDVSQTPATDSHTPEPKPADDRTKPADYFFRVAILSNVLRSRKKAESIAFEHDIETIRAAVSISREAVNARDRGAIALAALADGSAADRAKREAAADRAKRPNVLAPPTTAESEKLEAAAAAEAAATRALIDAAEPARLRRILAEESAADPLALRLVLNRAGLRVGPEGVEGDIDAVRRAAFHRLIRAAVRAKLENPQ